MNKRVYFAGSIRGGRKDVETYKKIIEHIQKTDIVLTEHIGDLSFSSFEDEKHDKEIYQQDINWLRECDLVIAECSHPSLGVGYELAYGEKLGKKVHVFYRGGEVQLSAMITGNPYFSVYSYKTIDELLAQIDVILQ